MVRQLSVTDGPVLNYNSLNITIASICLVVNVAMTHHLPFRISNILSTST